MLPFLFSNFVQKWYIPQGVSGFGNTRVQISDTDRDGNLEFIFTTYGSWPAYIYFYELHLPDIWEIDSVLLPGGDLLWDSGDFDGDGLYDLALQFHIENPSLADGIMIFESPDSFSYPIQEVWRDTIGSPSVAPICVYDIDQDGLPEIIKQVNYGIDIVIYESIGNNSYVIVYEDTINISGTSLATIPFGDFDGDSQIEFVLGNLSNGAGGANYWLYESPADNIYEFIHLGSVPTKNIKDCFAVPDADGDGKMEFVVKGYWVSGTIDAFIFEATGDNTYEIIKTFSFPGGDYYGGYSEAGDVDGDSIPEIVLEARQNVFIIKAAGNDSFYVWDTLPGHLSGSCVRVYDIDGNGLSEIVISGDNETRIYEYDPGGVEEARNKMPEPGYELQVYPNPVQGVLNIKYAVYTQTETELSFYDVTGSRKKSIQHEAQPSGWYQEKLDTKNLPSGIYFIVLKQGNKKVSQKFLLIQ
jgi:hypothetical protein